MFYIPQMKPMNWMILFLFTNLMLMMINLFIYFLKKNKNYLTKKKGKKNLLWKW